MGWRNWASGEIVTESKIQELQDQGVSVFADATARDAAITSPTEGMFAWLSDVDKLTRYDGSSWDNYDDTVDVSLNGIVLTNNAVTVTTSNPEVLSYVIAAGEPVAGDMYRLVAWGDLDQDSGASRNYTWQVLVDGTAILTTGQIAVLDDNNLRYWRLEVEVGFVSTSSQRVHAKMSISSPDGGASPEWRQVDATGLEFVGYGTDTHNSSSATDISVNVDTDNATATQTWTTRGLYVIRMNA